MQCKNTNSLYLVRTCNFIAGTNNSKLGAIKRKMALCFNQLNGFNRSGDCCSIGSQWLKPLNTKPFSTDVNTSATLETDMK